MKKYIVGIFCLLLGTAVGFAFYQKGEKIPRLVVYSSLNPSEPLALQAINVLRTLKNEMAIECVKTRNFTRRDPKDIRRYINEKINSQGKIHLFEDILWDPGRPKSISKYVLQMPRDQIKIAYSAIESSKIPPELVLILNCYFDAVIIPNRLFSDVYRNSGVKIPVFEVPLGINLDKFLKEPLKVKKERPPFVFGNLSSDTDCEGHLLLIKAFAKAFGNRNDVSLNIDTRDSTVFAEDLLKTEMSKFGLENVALSHLGLCGDQHRKFMQLLDCYICCSKGERFSVQPREAMTLGIPVVATDSIGQWANCKSVASNVDDLAEAMLEIYNHYEEFLGEGASARAWVEQYQLANIDKLYSTLINPPKVLLGNENKIAEDYLMTDSAELYQKYQDIME